MSRVEQVYAPALEGKDIPILPLDEKWQELFAANEKTPEIEALEGALSEKLAIQTSLREKIKEIKRLKKKLLNEIVLLRDPESTKGRSEADIEMEIQDHKRLISDCNERLESYEDELVSMPREIYQLNYKLMLATMNICYQLISRNTSEIGAIDEWIGKVRVQLKKNIIRLQEKEIENYNIYTYMHQIFGPDVIDMFDMHYDPEGRRPMRALDGNARKGIMD